MTVSLLLYTHTHTFIRDAQSSVITLCCLLFSIREKGCTVTSTLAILYCDVEPDTCYLHLPAGKGNKQPWRGAPATIFHRESKYSERQMCWYLRRFLEVQPNTSYRCSICLWDNAELNWFALYYFIAHLTLPSFTMTHLLYFTQRPELCFASKTGLKMFFATLQSAIALGRKPKRSNHFGLQQLSWMLSNLCLAAPQGTLPSSKVIPPQFASNLNGSLEFWSAFLQNLKVCPWEADSEGGWFRMETTRWN